jgi:hypothetical protein
MVERIGPARLGGDLRELRFLLGRGVHFHRLQGARKARSKQVLANILLEPARHWCEPFLNAR